MHPLCGVPSHDLWVGDVMSFGAYDDVLYSTMELSYILMLMSFGAYMMDVYMLYLMIIELYYDDDEFWCIHDGCIYERYWMTNL